MGTVPLCFDSSVLAQGIFLFVTISILNPPFLVPTQGENDQNTEEPFRVQSLESYRQDQLRNELLPDICGRNLHFSSNMGLISWDFIPTQQVLDLLFPSASPSFPGTWVDFYTEASHQPPGSLSLQLLLRSMWLLLGGLNLEHQAHHLLAQTEDGKSSQAEPESQADWATSSVPVTAPKPTPEPEPSPWEGAEPESRTSGVSTRSSSRPQYNKRVGGSCLIHVYLENERTTKYKSILVTCQDRVPVIIRRALDAHLLQQEDPENFELLQIVSNHQKLRIPADGNVYYALDGRVDYNFLLRETAASKWFKVKPKEFLEPSMAVASRIPAAVSSSSAVAAGPLPQATQSNERCMRKVTSSSSSLLHSSEQVEDSRLVHVLLEGQSPRETKRILVTCQERVTSLIRRALDQNLLQHEDVDNFELLRMMSLHEKIKVPDHSLMYLSMNPRIKYHFIVRKCPQVKGKEFSESTCKSSRPLSHKLVGDTCLIRVHLETQSPKMAKTVLVTCHDRAPVVIRRALELHLLTQEKPEEYELGQIISHHQSKWDNQMAGSKDQDVDSGQFLAPKSSL
ncbi:ral guanine nucleotide dissociation stimulator-like isoform X1 [Marmota monax]|uniref:ral guanine nucleotide dissociation stimulator-like isoform X1 n=2 Tax=Marmota monax TaxID=9995 RepID=UPI001EAFC7C8|nr:ral guanine nucleotide dissociation stimulator-like isoform X1 [Marmota monax]